MATLLYTELVERFPRAPRPAERSPVVQGEPIDAATAAALERRAMKERVKKQRPLKSSAGEGGQLNLGMGNLGGPGRLMNRLRVDGDLYEDLLEFNPIWVEEWEQRWSKRSAIVRMAHVQLVADLEDRDYVLEGGTREAREFHEAWLERILPKILDHVVDATWYGWQPFAIEWEERAHWPEGSPLGVSDAWVPAHVKDLDPFWSAPYLDERGDIQRIEANGESYGREQILWMTWQQEQDNVFGDGQAIAANPWWRALSLLLLWKLGYYEHSVDPQRLAWAKNIKYTHSDGTKVDLAEILADVVAALSGGDSGGLPLEYDENGNPFAKIETLNLPDRSDTFIKAIDKVTDVLYTAALIIPGAGFTANSQAFASSRSSEKRQVAVVQLVGQLVVKAVNRPGGPLENAHRINGLKGPCPKLKARPLKREQLDLLKELIKPLLNQPIVETNEDGQLTGKSYRGQDLVNIEAALGLMDIPTRSSRSVARNLPDEPAPGAGGRPTDPYGERAEDRNSGLER